MTDPADLDALEARDRIRRGEMSAADYTRALLARIAEREPKIGAFAHVDPQRMLAEADACDLRHRTGRETGPLGGLPVGVKDIIDTRDYPTENGTVLDSGRRPTRNAVVVDRVRMAGGVLAGKTVTTELAYFHPGGTRNPAAPDSTPGGSSSGSAATVAAGMLPLAIGTQTTGSVIRPASFCGVVGFKPTHGLIPRTGILRQADPLDTVGVFARSVADAALLADALAGYDPGDDATRPEPVPRLLETALQDPPVTPAVAFVRSRTWERADEDTRSGFEELAAALGPACEEVALPDVFDEAMPAHATLMNAGFARNFAPYEARGADRLSDRIRAAIAKGRDVSAVDYLAALDWRTSLNAGLEQLFERYDVILTPAAPGEAPKGLETTGDPIFNGTWTLLGVPAITLPLLQGANGLPIGVQLVARRGDDARLLRVARWLKRTVDELLAQDETA